MRVLVLSDLHGNIEYTNMINYLYNKEHVDKIILLGDLGSYYQDNYLINELIKKYKNNIICIKGNNDYQGDYNIKLEDFYIMNINNKMFYFTHGDLFDYTCVPDFINVYMQGHTHRGNLSRYNNLILANPGSIAYPRDGIHSYILIDENYIYLKDVDNKIIKKIAYN